MPLETQQADTKPEVPELVVELRALQSKVQAAVAYADDETSLLVEQAVYTLYATVQSVVSAKAAMGGD